MMHHQEHHCTHCGQLISNGEPWEYTRGAYPVGTLEEAKRRIHKRCFAQLLRDTMNALARVPEEQREQMKMETTQHAQLVCDETFSYATGLPAARVAVCRLRAWRREDGSYVAIATDLDTGASVTNAAEWLWAAVRERLALAPGTLLYSFEQYAHQKRATWDRVMPQRYDPRRKRFMDASWKSSSREIVEALIGQRLEE